MAHHTPGGCREKEENMYCRYCGSEMKGNSEHCKACGKDNYIYREPRKKLTAKQWKTIIAIVLAVAILIPTVYLGVQGVIYLTKENDLYFKTDYTVSADKVDKYKDDVVAVCGEHSLTNSQLQVFYWMRIYDYLSKYSSAYTTLEMDFKKPLNEQICDETTGKTWEQYFLEEAVYAWHRYTVLADAAAKEGYTLPKADQEAMDGLRASAEKAAEEAKAESLDAFLQTEMGPGITFTDYEACVKLTYIATSYYTHMAEELRKDVTNTEIEAYFIKNQDTLKNTYKITKESGNLVSVRHILIAVETSGKDANGKAVSTEEDWEACEAEAQKILDEYRGGFLQEERFAELATKHTEDPGSKETGGLYTGISATTNFVKPFLDWCMDESRYHGDVGLVKTDYGYHVMFFVDSEPGWIQYCRSGAGNEKCAAAADKLMEDHPIQTDYKKINMADFVLK